MICHLAIVDDPFGVHRQIQPRSEGKRTRNRLNEIGKRYCHIAGQKTAVRARVGQQTLFVQCLRIIQRLLGCIAKETVGFTLQGGQIVQRGRLFCFSLLIDVLYDSGFQIALLCKRSASAFSFIRGVVANRLQLICTV